MDGFKSLFTAIVENTGSWSLDRTEVAREEPQRCRRGNFRRKGKGRDIGYALAASFCEEAHSVESCTITAFDVITAFAVLTPATSRNAAGFFGSGRPPGCPGQRTTQLTSDWLILFEPTLSAVDARKSKCLRRNCQRRFSVQHGNEIVNSVDCNSYARNELQWSGWRHTVFPQLLAQEQQTTKIHRRIILGS